MMKNGVMFFISIWKGLEEEFLICLRPFWGLIEAVYGPSFQNCLQGLYVGRKWMGMKLYSLWKYRQVWLELMKFPPV